MCISSLTCLNLFRYPVQESSKHFMLESLPQLICYMCRNVPHSIVFKREWYRFRRNFSSCRSPLSASFRLCYGPVITRSIYSKLLPADTPENVHPCMIYLLLSSKSALYSAFLVVVLYSMPCYIVPWQNRTKSKSVKLLVGGFLFFRHLRYIWVEPRSRYVWTSHYWRALANNVRNVTL